MRVKEVAKKKGISISSLAEKMGVKQESLSRAINGNPTVETLNKIAEALDVPMWQLFVDPDKIGNNTHNLGNGFVCPNCGARLTVSKEED